MTLGVMPLASVLVPMIRNPLIPAAFVYIVTRYPMKETTSPFPIARCPNIPVAMRHVFDTGGRRGRIDYDVGPRRCEPRRQERGGDDDRQGGFVEGLHSRQPLAA